MMHGTTNINCPKHVEFHSKNKFEKLVHLVGFVLGNLSRCTVTWTSKYPENVSKHNIDNQLDATITAY